MSEFETLTALVLKGLENKLESSRLTDANIKKIVTDAIDQYWNSRVRLVRATLLGVTLLIGFGIYTPKTIFQPMLDFVYPASDQFPKFKPEILKLQLDELPKVSDGIPPRAWEAFATGKESDYQAVLIRPEFFHALKARFRDELVQTFGTVDRTVPGGKVIDPADVIEYGAVPVEAVGVVVARTFQGKATACGRTFDHNSLQGEVVIPMSLPETSFSWLGCSIGFPSETTLTIEANGQIVTGIRLVSVERLPVQQLQLRMSRQLAEDLLLPGAKNYDGKVSVQFRVASSK